MTPDDLAPFAGVCASPKCGRPLIWAITTKDKPIPIDPDPTDDGNLTLELEHRPGITRLRARVTTGANLLDPDPTLYRSHFATCPDAKDFRRRK